MASIAQDDKAPIGWPTLYVIEGERPLILVFFHPDQLGRAYLLPTNILPQESPNPGLNEFKI